MRCGILALVLAAVTLGACQDDKPKLSLSEARAVTDIKTRGMEGRGGAAVVRSSTDILALLDAERPDPAKVAELTTAADLGPPQGAPPAKLVEFYLNRSKAAEDLGRLQQRLDDIGRAAELARRHGVGDRSRVLQEMGTALIRFGRWSDAIAARMEEVAWVEANMSGQGGRLFGAYSFLSQLHASSGDFKEAQAWLDRLNRLKSQAAQWRNVEMYTATWTAAKLNAEAVLAFQNGRLADAEQLYGDLLKAIERSIALIPSWPTHQRPPAGNQEQWRDMMVARRAEVIARQGRLQEAEIEFLQALASQVSRRGRYAVETADMLRGYTGIVLERGQGADAEKLARVALDTYRQIGHRPDSVSIAYSQVLLGRALTMLRRDAEAVAVFEQAARDLAADPLRAERLVRTNASYAISLIRTGRAKDAVRVMEGALRGRSADYGSDHLDTAETRALLGVAKAAAGDRLGALADLKPTIPVLVRGTEALGAGGTPVRRVRTLMLILEAYLGLLADLGRGQAADFDLLDESFRIADIAHGSSVQQAIAANATRSAVSDPELAELVRRAQDARQQVTSLRGLLSELLASPKDQSSASAIADLRRDIGMIEAAVDSIDGEIGRRFPAFADLMRPRAVAPAEIEAALTPGEAMILTYVGEQRLFTWALQRGRKPAFAVTDLSRAELNAMVRSLRKSLDPTNDADISFDFAAAHRLYNAVLAPVAATWQGASTLTVVPDKALGQLPFAVLVTEPTSAIREQPGRPQFSGYGSVPWLIRKAAVVQLPSASSLLALRGALGNAAHARRPFIGFGDPLFNLAQLTEAASQQMALVRGASGKTVRLSRRNSPDARKLDTRKLDSLPRLPETADEMRAIAEALGADPAKDVIVGAATNVRTVKTMDLSDRRVVMFATHGLKAGDLTGLNQPALALSSPAVAGIEGSGLFTVDDVLGLKLNADWVVLSACNTAAPEGEGAEAISGLGRAFFYAGTRAVLVTSWAVETNSAAMLTAGVFRRQAADPSLSRAEALRQAELAVMAAAAPPDPATGTVEYSYAHPMFWAPYVLVGDGRAG